MSKKIIRSNTKQTGVPVLFDEIISGGANIQESKSVEYTENGEYSVVPDAGFDAVAQVDVTVNVPSAGGPVTSFEDPIVFDSIEDAEELNYYDVKGALVSYNASTGKYTAWNGEADLDARAWDYRADASSHAEGTTTSSGYLYAVSGWKGEVEFPTNDYGEVIAVCVGDGLWVSTKWVPENNGSSYTWCRSGGSIYGFQEEALIPYPGYVVTSALTAKVTADDESLFWTLKNFGTDDGTQGHLYVPNIVELLSAKYKMCKIVSSEDYTYDFTIALAHACRIDYNSYWSCCQDDISIMVSILGSYGDFNVTDKSNHFECLVFIRFGTAL